MYKLTSPFSGEFDETWKMWKEFRWAAHHFKYSNPISEQAALNELVYLSDGLEEKAKRIVMQSISKEWRGFYKLQVSKTEKDEQSTKKKATGRATGDDLKAVYIRPTGTEG